MAGFKPKHKMTREELIEEFILWASQDTEESGRAAVTEIIFLRASLASMKGERAAELLRAEAKGMRDAALLCDRKNDCINIRNRSFVIDAEAAKLDVS